MAGPDRSFGAIRESPFRGGPPSVPYETMAVDGRWGKRGGIV